MRISLRVSRLLDCFAHRLVLQEDLARQVARALVVLLRSRGAACVLDGMPRIMTLAAPMEILIQPALVFFIFQEAFSRRIHTGGGVMPASEMLSVQRSSPV